MKRRYDIDLWQECPADYRWDRFKNGKLLNIVFQGGTFGMFTKFFVEKFSKKTPAIEINPFTTIGTSHEPLKQDFSGLVQSYHSSFINDNRGETGLPICIILPSTEKHFLYLSKAQWFRPNDKKFSPDTLWKDAIGEMPEDIALKAHSIVDLYDIKEIAHFSWIPKFVVRDWYKMEFLKPLDQTYNYQWFDTLKKHEFFSQQKVFHLDVESFFDWNVFFKNMTVMDDFFGLDLDIGRKDEMKTLFDKGYHLDDIRQTCHRIEQNLINNQSMSYGDLDVSMEAYIYAHFEKLNPDIQMPLTNRFFRDSDEIKQFIEHFPNWYRRPNPNLG